MKNKFLTARAGFLAVMVICNTLMFFDIVDRELLKTAISCRVKRHVLITYAAGARIRAVDALCFWK